MEGLRFAYPTRPEVEVLKGVDLEVKKGQVSSGCPYLLLPAAEDK